MWGQWVKPYDKESNPPARRHIPTTKPKPIATVSDDDRDRAYRAILDQLSLSDSDRAELTGRGISDQAIDSIGFKTWIAGTRLTGDFPAGLPGLRGKSLSARSGYLIPVKDADGRILGLQIRPHAAGQTDRHGNKIPRYTWVSTEDAPIGGEDQEWPLAIYRAGTKIGLAEGTAAKPFLSAQGSGYSVIGAAGGMWANSPTRLKKALEDLGAKKGDAITLFADAGSFSNKGVKRRYAELYKLLKAWGFKLYVAGWGQFTSKRKGDLNRGDFDEIADTTPWRLFSWEQPSDDEANDDIGFLRDEIRRCTERDRYEQLTGFTATPDIKTSGRYIPLGSWREFAKPGLFLGRAVPDSGKTYAIMKPLVKAFLGSGKRVLSIATRRKLAEEQAQKIEGLTVLSNSDKSINAQGITCCWESLHKLKGQKFDLIIADELRLGVSILATSSTLKKRRQATYAVVEELFENTIKNGGTILGLDADIDDRTINYIASMCGENVKPIVHHHDQLPVARKVYTVGFRDFWDGAKINGRAFVMGLFKAHVLNICQQLQDGKPFDKLTDIPMLVSDSRGLIEDLETVTKNEIDQEIKTFINENEQELKTFLTELESTIKKDYPELGIDLETLILRIDQTTNESMATVKYASNPTEGKGNAIAVMISPAGFVGISDEDDRIKTVYGIFAGVTGVNLARQALGRARRAQNWVIAHSDSFALSDGRPSRQTNPARVLEDLQRQSPTEAGWQAISLLAYEKFGNRATKEISEYIAKRCDPESDLWINNHVRFTTEEWAISNYERANFGELLIERLANEGHELLSASDALHLAGIDCKDEAEKWAAIDGLTSTKDRVDEARSVRQEQRAIALAQYAIESEMDATEARDILDNDQVIMFVGDKEVSRPAVEEDRIEANAVLARDLYPGLTAKPSEDNPDDQSTLLVWENQELAREFFLEYSVKNRSKADDARRHWAFKNPGIAKKLAQQEILDHLDDSVVRGRVSKSIQDQRTDRRPLIVSDLLKGIEIKPGATFLHSDQNSQAILKNWQGLSKLDKVTLGISLSKGQGARLEFFAKLFEFVGFKVKREIKRKNAISILENDRFFDGMVAAIGRAKELKLAEYLNSALKVARRDREKAAKAARIAAQQAARQAERAAQAKELAQLATAETQAEPVTQAVLTHATPQATPQAEAIAPMENSPTPQATGDSAYDRAAFLYECWASGRVDQAAAAIQRWQRAIDPRIDPMGFTRIRSSVCALAQGLEDFWRYAVAVGNGTIAIAA
jgi:hypothetical protein